MSPLSRRKFLSASAVAAAGAAFLPETLRTAMAATAGMSGSPGRRRARRDADAGEPQLRPLLRHPAGRARLQRPGGAASFPNGTPVFHQPDPGTPGHLLPFHLDTTTHQRAGDPGLDHAWAAPAPGVEQRRDGRLGRRPRATYTMGYFTPGGHPVPVRARRRLHPLRQLLLLGAGPDQPEPAVPVDRDDRPERHRRRPGHRQHAARPAYTWTTYPERLQAAGISWKVYQESRQLRRQRAGLVQAVQERRHRHSRCTSAAW